ncbi:MAG TPA: M20/M25/M40 family metallo-hydrolase, partial [Candidatus Atribacteria bacterium]|nr:M20/M25/M40 family metallo-hydrolase [Candidatus Atribacteria bacterium]
KQLKEALKPFNVEGKGGHKPLYVSPDSELIKMLSSVYEETTREKAYLIAIGGGTYARIVPNAVAFGPLFPGREELAHKPNERILLDDLVMVSRIYAQLFKRVLTGDF